MKITSPGKILRFAALASLALAPTSLVVAADEASPPPAENTTSPVAADTTPAAPLEDAATVIARARAYLGTEEALNAVQSLHFVGMVTADDGNTRPIEIIMRRPMHEMIIETADEKRAVTALNDYTLWRRVDPIDRPGTGRVQLMSADAVRYTRANVAQTLFYYRDLESVGGTVAVEAEVEIEGVRCVRTVFTHPGNVRYIRFFDKTTGRLVITRSEEGNETRESGELIVAGVRFPTELTTIVDGKSSRVAFLDIRVNEEFDLAMFELPRPKFNLDAPTAPSPAEPPATPPPAEAPATDVPAPPPTSAP